MGERRRATDMQPSQLAAPASCKTKTLKRRLMRKGAMHGGGAAHTPRAVSGPLVHGCGGAPAAPPTPAAASSNQQKQVKLTQQLQHAVLAV